MTDRINLEVAASTRSFSTIRRVLGGLGARLGYSLDDLDDLYLGCEEVLRAALSHEPLERLNLEVQIEPRHLRLQLGHFRSPRLRADVTTSLAGCESVDLCRLLTRTMDAVTVKDGPADAFYVVLERRHRGLRQ